MIKTKQITLETNEVIGILIDGLKQRGIIDHDAKTHAAGYTVVIPSDDHRIITDVHEIRVIYEHEVLSS